MAQQSRFDSAPTKPRRRWPLVVAGLLCGSLLTLATLYFAGLLPKRGGVPTKINDSVQSGNWQALTENLDLKSRAVVYRQAILQGREITDWPATPEALVRAFWDAASKKQYERMALYCPGSLASDYKKYFDQWTPSPVKEFGAAPTPAPNPAAPPDEGVRFYYARVAFPFFPNKTVKMAVRPLEGGRLIIDGQKTVWW